jgi:hypothetical protein
MEVIFGVPARDGAIHVQFEDGEIADLKKRIDTAFSGGESTVLWVTDKDGKEFGIPTEKIAFIEFSTEKAKSRVGFSSES